MPAYFIMCCTAAFCEELIYRGYLINFFQSLFQGLPNAPTLSLLLPAFFFSAAHYYQGIKAVFKILVLSTLFGLLFLKSGSLLIVCLLHFLVDWCSGLLYAHFAKIEVQKDR
jgi:membrane protease YdiL (CAAX protease family)